MTHPLRATRPPALPMVATQGAVVGAPGVVHGVDDPDALVRRLGRGS